MIAATAEPCVAHKQHKPAPQYNELHHVVPQAWQHLWNPGTESLGSPARASLAAANPAMAIALWDPRTVALCPTGHRNVHFWIVRVMKALPPMRVLEQPDLDESSFVHAQGIARDQAHRERRVINPHEWQTACLAVQRWIERGGTLAALVKAGQWGEA